jgi:pimeloyl-ACP methyl ester carboxylesterase
MFDGPVNLNVAIPFSSGRTMSAQAGRMVPIQFGTCFGWLHSAGDGGVGASGIVLCPTLGQEARHVHRQWRILADRLAAKGHSVVRFDYPDTGDSWLEPGVAPLEAWVASIAQAADYLRARGVRHVTLLGFRFGATLAALAQLRINADAANDGTDGNPGGLLPVDRLVMLAPVVRGRLYIRELRALARLSGAGDSSAEDIESSGLQLDAATSRQIAGIDLQRDMRGQDGPVLMLDHGDFSHCDVLANGLRAQAGRDVSLIPFDDFPEFIRNAHTNSFPDASFTRIAAWLEHTAPQTGDDMVWAARPPSVVLHPPGARERPCLFGPDQLLFGVLCEPTEARDPCSDGAPSDVAVVICNNGSNPHHGHGRFAVTSGRAMAQAGVTTFRMDFAGLGDSAGGPAEDRPHLFDASRDAEISAALDMLEGHGYRRFILTGICAGAYHAFHGALADSRVVAVYAVNLPKFRWPVGDDPDQVIANSMHATSYYLRGIRQLQTWKRLVRNDINALRVSFALLQRLVRRIATGLMMPLALRFGGPSGTGFPRWAISSLSRRGVRLHLLYGHDDPGVEELVRCFGAGGRKLSRLAGCSVEIPDDVDHAISYARVRQAVHLRLLDFVRNLNCAPP